MRRWVSGFVVGLLLAVGVDVPRGPNAPHRPAYKKWIADMFAQVLGADVPDLSRLTDRQVKMGLVGLLKLLREGTVKPWQQPKATPAPEQPAAPAAPTPTAEPAPFSAPEPAPADGLSLPWDDEQAGQ